MAKKKKTEDIKKIKKNKTMVLFGPETTEEPIEDVSKKSPALFDFISDMFSKKQEFLEKTNYEKGVYGFMINRFMAIKAPVIATQFSKIGINQGNVVTSWALMFSKLTRTPEWMYVSTAKKKEENRKKDFDVKQATIDLYCKMYEIDMKTFNEAKERYTDELLKELKDLEQMQDM